MNYQIEGHEDKPFNSSRVKNNTKPTVFNLNAYCTILSNL